MAGRPSKPAALKELAGNPGTRPIQNEPEFKQVEIPKCPTHLKGEARKEWKRVSQELYEAGLLGKVDRAALAAYCDAYAQWVEASKTLQSEKLVLTSPNGYMYQNPWLSIANKAKADMTKFMNEFGMTPASRKKVSVNAKNENDPYDEWLNQA
jgi:P27 family predicted phage terminase small subunit